MAASSKKSWKDWAREWGLTLHPPRFLGTTREWMAGSHRGYLVKLGWLGDRHLAFYALVRFPKAPDAAVIRQRLLADPALKELPGWTQIKQAGPPKPATIIPMPGLDPILLWRWDATPSRPLQIDETSLLWVRPCPWLRPGAEKLQGWVEKLIVSLSQVTRPFEGRCEQCGRTVGQRFVMVNGVPGHLCEGCQQGLLQKGRMAEHQYEEAEAHHLLGALYGAVAAALGGTLWALISYGTGRMFVLVAIGIAVGVGFAYRWGAKKMDGVGQMIGVALTLGGVVFGDILFCALVMMKQRPDIGFRLDAGWRLYTVLLQKAPRDIILSLIFGLVGAFYVARILARPKFVPKIETDEGARAAA